jgi:Skp family chaperone for outer membrane proteins
MKKTFLAALGLSAASSLAWAQEPKAARLAVIDLNVVSRDSVLGKSYASRIETLEKDLQAEVAKKQGEVQKMEAGIKTLQDELEKQASVLSPEAADRKRQEITRKSRERQAFVEDSQAELQRMRERAQAQAESLNGEFQQKIRPHIEAVAKEKGVDIILTSQVALTVNKEYDLSPAVIARVDANEKAPAAAAAKPAPAPARPAAGAPAAAAPAPPAAPAPAPPAAPAPAPSPSPQP